MSLKQDWKYDHVARPSLEHGRPDRHCLRRQLLHENRPPVGCALTNQAFAQRKIFGISLRTVIGIYRQELEARGVDVLHLVKSAELRVDQWRKLRKQQSPDGSQIALSLKHAGEICQIGLQPILLSVVLGSQAQIADHRVDIVFKLSDLATRLDLDRARQIAFGHCRCDFSDGSNLRGQIRRE